jgi:uncharacterized protein YbaP (TraB family)
MSQHHMENTRPALKIRYALAGLLLLFSNANAQSPVWMVEKDGSLMFIGGTIHILTAQDYPLPAAFEKAYRQSRRVIFETDLNKMESPELQQYILAELSYSDGRNLKQVLREDTYLALAGFFSERGMSMSSIDNFKPGMVATLMAVVELQRLGIAGIGVDAHFNQRVNQDQKASGQLESVEAQIAFIANMGADNPDEMLAYNLADMKQLPELWQSMQQAWRSGNLAALDEIAASPLRADFPEVYQALLVDRNNVWMPQIVAWSKTVEVEFILVGALHRWEATVYSLSCRGVVIKLHSSREQASSA